MGHRVIDMELYERDYPGRAEPVALLQSRATYYSFANFDRYVQKCDLSSKLSVSGNLDILKVFSASADLAFSEIFSCSTEKDYSTVYGETTISYYANKYDFSLPSFYTIMEISYMTVRIKPLAAWPFYYLFWRREACPTLCPEESWACASVP